MGHGPSRAPAPGRPLPRATGFALVRLLGTLVWLAVFVVALLFAIKNAEPVTLQLYLDRSWQAPLALVVLAAFAVGAACGVVACLAPLVRQRREIAGLQKELRLRAAEGAPREAGRTLASEDVPAQR